MAFRRFVLLTAIILGCHAPLMAASKVAVIYERQGKVADLGALIETQLTGTKDVVLVERTRIDAVLKEQTLQALFSADGVGHRMELGKLLQADALVLLQANAVERNVSGKPRLDVVVCETHGGLRLANQSLPLIQEGETTVKAVNTLVSSAITRSRQPISTIVAVPALKCNDLSFTYQNEGTVYARLIERSLLNRPGVLVVELAEAQAVGKELQLGNRTVVDRQLPLYVLGEYRNNGFAEQRRTNLKVWLKRGNVALASKTTEGVKPEETGHALLKMTDELMDTQGHAPGNKPDAEVELKLLLDLAKQFEQYVQTDEALTLYEASLLLKNQVEGHRGAAKAIYDKLHTEHVPPEQIKPLLINYLSHGEAYAMLTPNEGYNTVLLTHWMTDLSGEMMYQYVPDELADVFFRLVKVKYQKKIYDDTFGLLCKLCSFSTSNEQQRDHILQLARLISTQPEQDDFATLLSNKLEKSKNKQAILQAVSQSENPVAARIARRMLARESYEMEASKQVATNLPMASPNWKPPFPPPESVDTEATARANPEANPDLQVVPLRFTGELAEIAIAGMMKAGQKTDLAWSEENDGSSKLWLVRGLKDNSYICSIKHKNFTYPLLNCGLCYDGKYAWGAGVNAEEAEIVVLEPDSGKQWKINAKAGLPPEPFTGFVAVPLAPGKIFASASFGPFENTRTWVALIYFDSATGACVNVFHEAKKPVTDKHEELSFSPYYGWVVKKPIKGKPETADRQVVTLHISYDDWRDWFALFEVVGDKAKFLSMKPMPRGTGPSMDDDMVGKYQVKYNNNKQRIQVRSKGSPWQNLRIKFDEGYEPDGDIAATVNFGAVSKCQYGWGQIVDGNGNLLTESTIGNLLTQSREVAPATRPAKHPALPKRRQ